MSTGTSISSGVLSVGGLFAGRRFGLTYYQRDYAWSRSEVKALLTDLRREFSRGETSYYLGAIVFYQADSTTFLIDGQQRITTLNLLLFHLRRLLEEQSLPTAGVDALILPGPDRDSFALEDPGVAEGSSHVARRYAELAEDFPADLTGEFLSPFVAWLLDSVFVVGIEAADREHGWRIFETTNDRGVRLGPLDLLKGHLLVNAAAGQEALGEVWRTMVADLATASPRAASDFVKSYLTARYATLADTGDRQRIDDAFHEWVRDCGARLGLDSPADYARFVQVELAGAGRHYALLARAATRYTPQWAPVFFNEHNGIPHHLTAILAATSVQDTDEVFATKALLVARYLDLLFIRRLVRAKIQDAADLGPTVLALVARLRGVKRERGLRSLLAQEVGRLGDPLPPPDSFALTPDNAAQVRYVLARLTSYVDSAVGREDRFAEYLSYAITHLWGEDPAKHHDSGNARDFAVRRERLGGLVLFPAERRFDENSSYQAKLNRYHGATVLSSLLHPQGHADPAVAAWLAASGQQENLHPVTKHFTQNDMAGRQAALANLALRVWDPVALGLVPDVAEEPPPPAPPPPPPGSKQAILVRKLLEAGHLRSGDQLVGHARSGEVTATLLEDGRVQLTSGQLEADLNSAGRRAQKVRACDGWKFWWVQRPSGLIQLEVIRQAAHNVGDI